MSLFKNQQEKVNTTPIVADEIKTTTCYMCACRCGIKVYLKNGKVRYIEGNPDHPVNRGVLCAKGSAGIMNHYSPARLTSPLLRVGERGKGEFKEISWDEALDIATQWLGKARKTDPNRLAFFTGRDQSQSFTGWWATQFGTNNFAAHGGFCSVNMAVAGLYTVGGAFWEFGEPDWEKTKYFLLFGVAEDHDSNPIKIGLGKLKKRKDSKFISINPVRSGYSAIADEWLPIKPGSDGLLIMAIIHELLKADKIDFKYLARYTNSTWLVIDDPDGEKHGLFARDDQEEPLTYDTEKKQFVTHRMNQKPAFTGSYVLPNKTKVVPVFELIARRYLDKQYSPDAVQESTGIEAKVIKRIAAEIAEVAFEQEITINQPWTDWIGNRHETMTGRPVSMHAMRGISAHSNGFQTCRALHLLQIIIGSIDTPGGWRYKCPYPKEIPPPPLPARFNESTEKPLQGSPIGHIKHPKDLLVDKDGKSQRIDKAYSWEFPLASHGLLHMLLHNAWAGDPYPIDVVMLYMANMAWNSSMNVKDTLHYLTDKHDNGDYKIKRLIYSDAYYSETVPYADLVLPDTTYLERYDCISLLDRPIGNADGPGDAIRVPIETPKRAVRPFQDVLLDLGTRLKLPGMVNEKNEPQYPGGYPDYMVNHQRTPNIGPLSGWRADGNQHGTGSPNPKQLEAYIKNGCFWFEHLPPDSLYYKHGNQKYLEFAHKRGWIQSTNPIIFQLYSETLQLFRLSAKGAIKPSPPEQHRDRIARYFDPLPIWYQPFEHQLIDSKKFPLYAITQRPMHMYHSWGSQNIWLRQITNKNYLYIHQDLAKTHHLKDGDWIWLISHHAKIRVPIQTMSGTNKDTVWTWNAIGKRRGAWGLKPDAPEFNQAFLLNHLISELLPKNKDDYSGTNADPITGQAAWYDLRVRIEKCSETEQKIMEPMLVPMSSPRTASIKISQFGKELKGEKSEKKPVEAKEWLSSEHHLS